MKSKRMPHWFAVKGLYRWYDSKTSQTLNIEERIVLLRATGLDEAIAFAEREAVIYCEADSSANFGIETVGWWNAYKIGEEKLLDGVEIYSRSAVTSLSGRAFVRRYYPKSQDCDPRSQTDEKSSRLSQS